MMPRKFAPLFVLLLAVILALVVSGIYFFRNKTAIEEEAPQTEILTPSSPFVISQEEITEQNFSGNIVRISGDTQIAKAAQAYIDDVLEQFRIQADLDVPDMRREFGPDSPSANYSIDINATRVYGTKTESAVISVYTYTGGAHGSSAYKVFTASVASGELLTLKDIIKPNQREGFVAYVKDKLMKWQPGGEGPVVFKEEVEDLVFESFSNWSLNEDQMILYFSQYEIGPGVLGAVAFPFSLEELSDFLI
jgi:hypothetical protein